MRNRYRKLLLCCLAFSLIFGACEPLEGSFEEVLAKAKGGEKNPTDGPTISVGAQSQELPAAFMGSVTYIVATSKISNDEYTVTVNNLPPGVTVSGNVTIYNNSGLLTLAHNTSTQQGTYTNLTLTINNVTSGEFTLKILQADAPVIMVNGSQSGQAFSGTAKTVTYSVTTANIADNSDITLNNINSVAGISLITVKTTANATTVSISTTAGTPGGFHPLSLNIGGAASNQFTLQVKQITKVGTIVGQLFAGTAGTITLPVETAGISTGSRTASVTGITGVSVPGGQVSIGSDGKGTLTLAGSTGTSAGTSNMTLTIDDATLGSIPLTIKPKKTFTVGAQSPTELYTKASDRVGTYPITGVTSIDPGTYTATLDPAIPGTDNTATKIIISSTTGTLTIKGSFIEPSIAPHTHTVSITSDGIQVGSSVTVKIIANPNGDGSESNPYMVGSENDLKKIGSNIDDWTSSAYYEQSGNITLTSAWTPIATFSGTYDGNGNTINGLTFNASTTPQWGLFRAIGSLGTVKNVKLNGVNISGNVSDIGAVAGANYGKIENCHVSGYISGKSYIGGLVGTSYQGEITNCSFSGSVNGDIGGYSHHIGGIVGSNNNGATVERCFVFPRASNPMDSISSIDGCVGGVAGSSYGIIKNCYTTIDVNTGGANTGVGGIAGLNSGGTVEHCYARGKVDGNGAGNSGGVAGDGYGNGKVEYCVALNDEVIGSSASRVWGLIRDTASASNNFAKDTLVLKDGWGNPHATLPDFGGDHGTNIIATDWNSAAWWSNTSTGPGFSTTVWNLGDNSLPTLK